MLLSINTKIVDKPTDRRNFDKGFKACDISAAALTSHIQSGHAFSAQFLGGKRKADNFTVAGFLAVDVDEGLTLDEAIQHPFIRGHAAFLYTTASHTSEHHRFRIVFELTKPIRGRHRYVDALTGLITKLGGDRACKDAARIFFGFRGCEVHHIGMVLPDQEVDHLVASVKAKGSDERSVSATGSMTASGTSITMDSLVKRADGGYVALSSITAADDRTVHCPFHVDRHASACVVFSQSGSVGIYCHSCSRTVWVHDARQPVNFDWHLPYQRQAADFLSNWQDHGLGYGSDATTPQFMAADGTNVWLYDDRHLPKVPIHPGLTYIRSPKGSGKTVQLASIVEEFKRQGKRILLVGHRRMLLRSLAERLGLPCYLNHGSREELADTGSIVVSLENLHRFVNPKINTFDVIIIDESEQVVSHFSSDTLAKQRTQSLMLIEHLIAKAGFVICADADMGLLTSGFFYLTLGKSHPDSLIINRYTAKNDIAADSEARISVIDLHDDKKSLYGVLAKDVIEGKRCFVACNSKTQAESIAAGLIEAAPDKRLLLITANTSRLKESKAFIRRPAVESLKYDVVVCSPALSTGVDISFPNDDRKFDCVYGFFRDGVTTHFEIDQQLSRVRNPGCVRVWVSPKTRSFECDPSAICEELVRSRDAAQFIAGYSPNGDVIYSDNKVLELIAWIWHLKRSSLGDLRHLFIGLRQQNGWTVNLVDPETRVSWNESGRHREDWAHLVADAKNLKREDYDWLKVREKGLGVTPEQDAQMRKYELREQYGVANVTPELVALDDDGRFFTKFWNLRLLYLGDEGLRTEDRIDIQLRGLASIDWEKRELKKKLLEKILGAAGLWDAKCILSFERPVSKESLRPFIDAVLESRSDIEGLLGLSVRDGDIHSKPVIQLKNVLDLVGMRLGKMERKILKGRRTDSYRLDRAHWEHVVTTCGMDFAFVVRQIVDDQIDVDRLG